MSRQLFYLGIMLSSKRFAKEWGILLRFKYVCLDTGICTCVCLPSALASSHSTSFTRSAVIFEVSKLIVQSLSMSNVSATHVRRFDPDLGSCGDYK